MLRKVLIVDDESSIANLLGDIVGMLDIETKILNDGTEVLAIAKEWKPDLITLDIMMPGPSGIEVLSQLKSDPQTESIPVFIISVVSQKPEFAIRLASAEKIFEKPIDTKKLVQHIQKLVTK